jgi:cysteine protease ATG4
VPNTRHLFLTVKEDGPTRQSAEAGISSETTGKAWPEAFLSDFGSRQWMTYRSNFTPIPRAKSPEAASSMTLSVRLRSQLMDSQGFTSDTGWGCMIRSGQSLLANTFAILLLGRGERQSLIYREKPELTFAHQTGAGETDQRRSRS